MNKYKQIKYEIISRDCKINWGDEIEMKGKMGFI